MRLPRKHMNKIVEITRNVQVLGEHREAGTRMEVTAPMAQELELLECGQILGNAGEVPLEAEQPKRKPK